MSIKSEMSVSRDTKKRHGKAVSLLAAGEGFEQQKTLFMNKLHQIM